MPITNAFLPIDFRKLAAIDIVFLGRTFIVAEYAAGVFLSLALGLFILDRGHSLGQTGLGMYFLCLGVNYVPLLVHACLLANKDRAQAEMTDELTDKRRAMSKYRLQSLLLLVPLVVPILAVTRERRRSDSA
jgi:hypothetical protein